MDKLKGSPIQCGYFATVSGMKINAFIIFYEVHMLIDTMMCKLIQTSLFENSKVSTFK